MSEPTAENDAPGFCGCCGDEKPCACNWLADGPRRPEAFIFEPRRPRVIPPAKEGVMNEPTAENDAIDRFITDAMNRGIIPMHVAADLSQYLVEEWSEGNA